MAKTGDVHGPPNARVLQIAQNKLRALHVPTYLTKERALFGRIQVDPSSFPRMPGDGLEALHTFGVIGHDRLAFIAPSPFRFVGSMVFFDVESVSELEDRVRALWAHLLERTSAAMVRARQFYRNVQLEGETWSLTVPISTSGGVSKLRLLVREQRVGIQLVSLDGTPWDANALGTAGLWLEEDPQLHDSSIVEQFLREARQKRRSLRESQAESMDIDLRRFGLDDEVHAQPAHRAVPPQVSQDMGFRQAAESDRAGTGSLGSGAAVGAVAGGAASGSGAVASRAATGSGAAVARGVVGRDPRSSVDPISESLQGKVLPPLVAAVVEGATGPMAVLEPSSDVILQLGTQDFVEPPEAAPPAVARLPRLRLEEQFATLSISGLADRRVRIADLTLLGLFVGVSEADAPPVGISVSLTSGAGYPIAGRVVHARNASEGALLKTGSGFGVQLFSAPGTGSTEQRVPVTTKGTTWLVMVKSPEALSKVVPTLAEVGTRTLLVAGDILDALTFLHWFPVQRIALEPSFGGPDLALTIEALGLSRLGVEVFVLSDASLLGAVSDGRPWVQPMPLLSWTKDTISQLESSRT